jgi:hypothetical protein
MKPTAFCGKLEKSYAAFFLQNSVNFLLASIY